MKIRAFLNLPIWKIINKGKFFLLASFINCFTPLFLCIIASYINPYGAQAVMGVGYTSTFMMTFAQLGISFATSTFFIIKRKINSTDKFNINNNINHIMSHSIILSALMGIFIVIIYFLSTYFYMYYSNNRENTIQTLSYGLDFIFFSLGYIFLICLNSLLILYIKLYNNKIASIIQFSGMIFIIIFSAILGIYTQLSVKGIGLACTIGSILILIISSLIIIKKFKFKFFISKNIKLTWNGFKKIMQESIAGISLSLSKGIGIFVLGLVLPTQMGMFIPLSYQMARVIWFNLMNCLVWVSIGISDSIKFYNIYSEQNEEKILSKDYTIISICSMLITLLFCVGGWYLVEPLAKLYIRNGQWDPNLKTPELLPGMPEFITDPKGNINLNWFLKELKDNKELDLWILNNPLIFSRWMLNYVGYTSYNVEVITRLLNYDFHSGNISFVELFALEDYNSKSSIYIFIYAILCSGWTVLLPSTTAITKKEMKWWLLMIVYAIIIGSILWFGINFSIIDTSYNRKFKFMDAWTFPLMITACVVSSYVWLKWIIISCKYHMINKRYNCKSFSIN